MHGEGALSRLSRHVSPSPVRRDDARVLATTRRYILLRLLRIAPRDPNCGFLGDHEELPMTPPPPLLSFSFSLSFSLLLHSPSPFPPLFSFSFSLALRCMYAHDDHFLDRSFFLARAYYPSKCGADAGSLERIPPPGSRPRERPFRVRTVTHTVMHFRSERRKGQKSRRKNEKIEGGTEQEKERERERFSTRGKKYDASCVS